MKKDLDASILDLEKEVLQNCENEPIRNIGCIQSFGFLLALNTDTYKVTDASGNCVDWFNTSIDQILGAHISELFSKEIVHQCNNALSHITITTQREYVGRVQNKKAFCEVFAHLKQESLIVELQPIFETQLNGLNILDKVQRVLFRLKKSTTVNELLEQSVLELRFISGFDRVKAYQFLSDGAGEVVAESKVSHVESFLGLRFPSFDIPQAARKLYETTPIRIIPSVNAEQVPILSTKINSEQLDLSLAILRGVVPVHTMYLQNMGVKATLSLPIVIEGKMWGLFAFHHEEECMLNSQILSSLEILGSTISMILSGIIQKKRLENIKNCTRVASIFFIPDQSIAGFRSNWEIAKSGLATLMECHGVSLVSENKIDTYGVCPENSIILKLIDCLQKDFEISKNDSKPIAIESISVKYPDLDCGKISGVLAIQGAAMPFNFLLYFRKETDKTVRWAGNPKKDIEKTQVGFRLNPRASFAEYINSKQKQSDKFNEEEIVIAESLKQALLKVTSNAVIQTDYRNKIVIQELNHRIRNILALVSSIISQSGKSSHSIEDYINALEMRIQSLSETQKLLTEFEWKEVGIRRLFERSLILCNDFLGTRIILDGNKINLPPVMASLLSLIISELSLNALKYGALSNSVGKIHLSWKNTEEELIIFWKETGGPIVQNPTHQGFGTTLITEALTYEFNAVCDLYFFKEGIEAKFSIPFNNEQVEAKEVLVKAPVKSQKFKSFTVLILEDDYVISKKMTELIKNLGATKVDAVPKLEAAAKLIEVNKYDVAFLDVNIHGEFSGEFSKLLNKKNIPFAFVTGYGSKDQELSKLPSLAVLSKPVNKDELIDVLSLIKL